MCKTLFIVENSVEIVKKPHFNNNEIVIIFTNFYKMNMFYSEKSVECFKLYCMLKLLYNQNIKYYDINSNNYQYYVENYFT
mgnify:CR=1 FL=1